MIKKARSIKTPVLVLVFNRIDTTVKVFEAIRNARPTRLYIAADGPRSDREGEDIKVLDVRNFVLKNIDWPCEVKTLFRESNLGCGLAVSNAIDWFFDFEETGIIFEDDVLPDPSFFAFCEELLDRYHDDPKVMMISGNNFTGINNAIAESYYFSKYPHIWGWATWRRAWKCNDRQMSAWPKLKHTDFLYQLADGNGYFTKYWTEIFDIVHAGRDDIWDYQFTFSCWANQGLCIIPCRNLVKNIGFGAAATHTSDDKNWMARLPLQQIALPLVHPVNIERNIAADRWTDRYVFNIDFITCRIIALKLWVIQQPGGNLVAGIYRFIKGFVKSW